MEEQTKAQARRFSNLTHTAIPGTLAGNRYVVIDSFLIRARRRGDETAGVAGAIYTNHAMTTATCISQEWVWSVLYAENDFSGHPGVRRSLCVCRSSVGKRKGGRCIYAAGGAANVIYKSYPQKEVTYPQSGNPTILCYPQKDNLSTKRRGVIHKKHEQFADFVDNFSRRYCSMFIINTERQDDTRWL